MRLKKFFFLFTTLVFTSCFSFSQNLISNGSFEQFPDSSYPEKLYWRLNEPVPSDWIFIGTVDMYLSGVKEFWCCSLNNYSAPDGKIYIGLIGYTQHQRHYREYALGLINRPLIKGHRYLLSFSLQYSNNSLALIDKFHVFFLNDKHTFPYNIRDGFPDTTQVIEVLMNEKYIEDWNYISDTIIAKGDEVEIVFGNLNDDDGMHYRKLNNKYKSPHCYIFLDNISLTPLDSDVVMKQEMKTDSEAIVKINDIRFNFNDTTFPAQYKDTLSRLTNIIKRDTSLFVRLTGFTDSIGNYQYNLKLSQRRANAIKNILIRNGISAEKILADYKSYLNPVRSNETERDRSLNRRVEVVLLRRMDK